MSNDFHGFAHAAPPLRLALLPLAAIAIFTGFSGAHAAGTLAGSLINNTATATYDNPTGGTQTINSNTVSLKVDELLNVSVAGADPGDVAADAGATNAVTKFTITNGGNGSEAFSLGTISALGGDDFDPTVVSVYIDSNGNGVFDAGVDTLYAAGSNDPTLNPDQSVTVFVVSSIPGTATDGQRGQVQLSATSKTGSGTPGTTFAGLGDGGGNAVVGATTAAAKAGEFYKVAAASMAFTKAAAILDPFGGSEPVPGATITYTLTAVVTGSGHLNNVVLSDAVPGQTTYVANSITLDGVAQTDAADADPSKFASGTVSSTLGTVNGGTTRIVKFKVKIN